MARYAAHRNAGFTGRDRMDEEVLAVRGLLARDWGVARDEIGFVSSVADGCAMLGESLDLAPGSNVVAADIEYSSVLGGFALRPGVEMRVGQGLAGIPALVDAQTRAILVSDISQLTGEAADLPALRALADAVGAALIVDFTQAAGWKRIEAGIADFAFSSCYKWLLASTGIAVAYWNMARQPGWAPLSGGWFSLVPPIDWQKPALVPDAMRFCRGNPAFVPLYMLGHAVNTAHGWAGTAALEAHVLALASAMRQGVLEAGLPCWTPARHGANVCIPHAESAAAVAALQALGVMTWGGRGRVRFSFHGYNGMADVQAALAALRQVMG
jgi:selenocysteine lyase/cysteine desulfurase